MHVRFQEKVESVATSVQLRSQIQVSVQLSLCQNPGEGDFLLCVIDQTGVW